MRFESWHIQDCAVARCAGSSMLRTTARGLAVRCMLPPAAPPNRQHLGNSRTEYYPFAKVLVTSKQRCYILPPHISPSEKHESIDLQV